METVWRPSNRLRCFKPQYPLARIRSSNQIRISQKENREGREMRMIHSVFFFFFVLLVIGVCDWSVQAKLLPPARRDGFLYPSCRVEPDSILIEAFIDPVCSDSRDAWPPLKQALDLYGSRVSLIVYLLPLPYHDNAFAASRALHIVNVHDTNSTFRLLEGIFNHQENFYNAQTQHMSRLSVVNEFVKFGTELLGNSFYSILKSGFSDSKYDLATRVSFKYSASRGVSATPTFYVNGFVLPDAGSPIDLDGWRDTIKPLLEPKGLQVEDGPYSSFLTEEAAM